MTEMLNLINEAGKVMLLITSLVCVVMIVKLLSTVLIFFKSLYLTLSPLEKTAVRLDSMSTTADNIADSLKQASKKIKKSLKRAHAMGHFLELLHLKKRKRR